MSRGGDEKKVKEIADKFNVNIVAAEADDDKDRMLKDFIADLMKKFEDGEISHQVFIDKMKARLDKLNNL
ncbi:hypothetical protein A2U01_0069576, partial [Trifolium medium]|nr:hypothetical protein [Trifolium medium]